MDKLSENPRPPKKIKLALNRDFTIRDINYYNLTETFKYLDGNDLLQLHKAHSLFHEAIYYVLRTNDKELVLVDHDFKSNAVEDKDLLSKFGDGIKNIAIKLEDHRKEEALKEAVHKYWTRGNVEKCTFHGLSSTKTFSLSNSFVHRNINLFTSLKSLTLKNVNIKHHTLYKILNAAKQLKELRILMYDFDIEKILKLISTYQLELLHFKNLPMNVFEYEICPVNNTITDLSFTADAHEIEFVEHFPNVECLSILMLDPDDVYVDPIAKLENLTVLTLEFVEISDTHLCEALLILAKVNTLKEFTLIAFDFQNVGLCDSLPVIDALCKMTNLTTLNLDCESYCSDNYLRLAREIRDLRNFRISLSFNNCDIIQDFLCRFTSVALNLNTISFNAKWSLNEADATIFYNKLSEELSEIREMTLNVNVLNVIVNNCFDKFSLGIRNKWVNFHNVQYGVR